MLKEKRILVEEELESLSGFNSSIVVYNDDHNTFEWVESFVDVLNHNSAQAEQLAFMIHYKGKHL